MDPRTDRPTKVAGRRLVITCEVCGSRQLTVRRFVWPERFHMVCHCCETVLAVVYPG